MENKIKEIKNEDLIFSKYNEQILKYNMEQGKITPNMVLKHQKNLSNEFIFEYIINEKYAIFMKDYDITINKVIGLHPNFANFNINEYIKNKNHIFYD
jgi:hypothetical protein